MATSLKESSAKYEVAYWLEEIARTLGTFKLSGFSPLPFKRVDKLIGKYLEFRNSHFAVLIFQYKIMIGFKVLIIVTLLVAGSLLLMNNEISIGQFVAADIAADAALGYSQNCAAWSDVYQDAGVTYDIKATYNVNDNVKLYLDAVNITDESNIQYFEGNEYSNGHMMFLSETYGPTYQLGVNVQF